jgi:predicted acyltransferase
VIELFKVTKWTYFFEVFGKNPLFIYILSGVLIQLLIIIRVNGTSLNGWIYQNLFLSWSVGENASLAFAVSYTLVLWLIGLWMMKKKIFIKV